MSAANFKKLASSQNVFSNDKVAELLAQASVDADFANRSVLANKRFCTYAIDSMTSIIQYATRSINAQSLKSNVYEVLATAKKFADANETFTLKDAVIALDKSIKADAKKKHLYVRRETHFESAKRHADMTINAMIALNAMKYTNKTDLAFTDTEISKAIQSRLAE